MNLSETPTYRDGFRMDHSSKCEKHTELFRRKLGKIFLEENWGLLDVTPKAGSVRQKLSKLDFVAWKNLGFHLRIGL